MANIDRADWHSGGKYPADLPDVNSGTHIGIYLAWVIHRGLGSRTLAKHAGHLLDEVLRGRITGRALLLGRLDGKLFPGLLGAEARAFTKAYYETNQYFEDYDRTLGGTLPTLFHVEDSWTNYDRMAAVLDERLVAWRAESGQAGPDHLGTEG